MLNKRVSNNDLHSRLFSSHLILTERPFLISQLDVFFRSMSKTFGVTNVHVATESHLRTLVQRGSALDYTNKFTTLAANTKWNDAAMILQYHNRLKTSFILDLLYPRPPLCRNQHQA